MLSKYNFYEYRAVKEHDFFVNYAEIGLKNLLLVRMRGDYKVSFVCSTHNPFKERMKELANLSCGSKNGTLLLINKEYGF